MTSPDNKLSGRSGADRCWPRVSPLGIDGVLISFGDHLSEPANRAALAFRAGLERASLEGAEESSTSLCSVYLRFDLDIPDRAALFSAIEEMAAERDWYAEGLPEGRRLWRIPTVFATELAPQLDVAAERAGFSGEQAVQSITAAPVRVLTIGFAPGQPYLGELDPDWNIPRQETLTERIPVGALTVAIRQLVLFSVSTPTGWWHVGQTAFRAFRPESETPFVLRPGDEVLFEPVAAEGFPALQAKAPDGGATAELLR
jgi:KipI family sensor histidine kinase inhibitor